MKNSRKARSSSPVDNTTASDGRKARPHLHKEPRKQFKALNSTQLSLYKAATSCPMVMAVGPAGTGKSYVLAHAALDLYFSGVIRKIVITRPPEPVGATLGLFKGDLKEKMLNWLAPILSQFVKVLEDSCGGNAQSHLNNLLESVIVLQPLETAKGSSFDDTFVLLEEAQDSNLEALRVLATRIGTNSVLALNGDFGQSHIRNSGFRDFVEKIRAYDEQVESAEMAADWQRERSPVIHFSRDDIVRSGLTRKMVEIFY